jgi:hypothetical protein
MKYCDLMSASPQISVEKMALYLGLSVNIAGKNEKYV